jgi:uncharacterized protein (DUF1697 family)
MGQWQIALLRGVNTGKANRIEMADLRDLVAGLGYREVQTALNSGNVVFRAGREGPAAAASRIEQALEARLAIGCRVIVVTASQLATIIAENPLLEVAHNPSRLLVAVLRDPGTRAAVASLLERDWGPEALAVGSLAAYLWLPQGVAASQLNLELNRALRGSVTSRNWATVLKLAEMVRAG